MIQNLFSNINFWAFFLGFIGTVFIFFWGIPSRIDFDGHDVLVVEQKNKKEKKLIKKYKFLSYIGLFMLGFSFVFQIINLIK